MTPILQQLEDCYQRLRARDRTIRKYQNEIDRQRAKMREAHQLAKIARLAQRKQEEWLREEAAAQIRREHGIQTIPGFKSRRESAVAFRKNLHARMREATAAAKTILNAAPPSP